MLKISNDNANRLYGKIFYLRVVEIGKDDNFIYSVKIYSKQGKVTHSYTWGKLDFQAIIPNKLFYPPKGKQTIIKSKQEFYKYLKEHKNN
jgi:hypothetical protein